MPDRLFVFVQFDVPFQPGPPPGRYVVRGDGSGHASHVLVFSALRAAHRRSRRPGRWRRMPGEHRALGGAAAKNATADAALTETENATAGTAPPETVAAALARITVIDAAPLPARQQAQGWLEGIDAERDVAAALGVLNRALFAHRQAAADPHVHDLHAAQAIGIRAGWGTGEEVAHGRFAEARTVPPGALAGSARSWRARARGVLPSLRATSGDIGAGERFALLLGGREEPLLCEELALRARLDLEHGRVRLAALELEQAYAAAVVELANRQQQPAHPGDAGVLPGTDRSPARAATRAWAARVEELERLQGAVAAQGARALEATGAVDAEAVGQALARLEAAFRARAAQGATG